MVATASLYNGVCYSSPSAALDAFYTPKGASMHFVNPQIWVFYYSKVAGVWNYEKHIANGTLWSKSYSQPVGFSPTFPLCDATQPLFDGMEIGWGVAVAMFAALGIVSIKQAFFK
ncbi:MAG: hypothetical protein WC742_13465 [Gallionellaceae bacterium]|jgi:hypothetical protein